MDSAELEGLEVGDMVEGTVVKTSPEIRISRKMARGKASLELLRGMYENRVPVEGKVSARNKGGFDVNIGGLRAFCPLSQIALGKIDNPDQFVGQTYEFRVTELEGAEIPAALEHLAAREVLFPADLPLFASQEKSTRYLRTELEDWIFSYDYADRMLRDHFHLLTLDGQGLAGRHAALLAPHHEFVRQLVVADQPETACSATHRVFPACTDVQ